MRPAGPEKKEAMTNLNAPSNTLEWVSVTERLPEGVHKHPGGEHMTDVVLVCHRDNPDYPVTAHALLTNDDYGHVGIRTPTNGASRYKWVCWYSVGRNLSNPFNRLSGPEGPFQDSASYDKFLPSYFGRGITHWCPLPCGIPKTRTDAFLEMPGLSELASEYDHKRMRELLDSRALAYTSENAEIYRAQDGTIASCAKAIRSLKEKKS